jgi:hypothetical protein
MVRSQLPLPGSLIHAQTTTHSDNSKKRRGRPATAYQPTRHPSRWAPAPRATRSPAARLRMAACHPNTRQAVPARRRLRPPRPRPARSPSSLPPTVLLAQPMAAPAQPHQRPAGPPAVAAHGTRPRRSQRRRTKCVNWDENWITRCSNPKFRVPSISGFLFFR